MAVGTFVGYQLCKALRLDPDRVQEITIHAAAPNQVATVQVTQILLDEDMGQVMEVLRQYELVAKEEPVTA